MAIVQDCSSSTARIEESIIRMTFALLSVSCPYGRAVDLGRRRVKIFRFSRSYGWISLGGAISIDLWWLACCTQMDTICLPCGIFLVKCHNTRKSFLMMKNVPNPKINLYWYYRNPLDSMLR